MKAIWERVGVAASLLALIVLIWAVCQFTQGARQVDEALHAAAKPFEGHPDQVTGPRPEDVIRATGYDPADAIE
jgi:hypothetical protein